MDVERNLNNQPLTYIEAGVGEKEVLTPNTILWGRDVHPVDDTEASDAEKLTRMIKRLENGKAHAWKRWKGEYVHCLMESTRLNKERASTPNVGEVVIIVGDAKNRGKFKREKGCALFKERTESLEE